MPSRASVIIPVFNGERVITEQLAALNRQACRSELEIIVVDDGSRDRTADVVDSWLRNTHAAKFRLARRRKRGGPNAARNVGLSLAGSELVLFCDGDDVVDDRWATAMIDAFRPGTILSGSYLRLGGDPNNPRDRVLPVRKFFGWEYAPGGNLGVERSLAITIGGFDESIRFGGTEVEFCIRAQLMANASITRVEDAIVGYRFPEGAMPRFSRAFRRERGHAYIVRRYGDLRRGKRAYLRAAKQVARSLSSRGAREPYPKDFFAALGRLIGLTFWSIYFRFRVPQPMFMTQDAATNSPSLYE
jgi:glycosyltransferase involved in cell wall biosynthesis